MRILDAILVDCDWENVSGAQVVLSIVADIEGLTGSKIVLDESLAFLSQPKLEYLPSKNKSVIRVLQMLCAVYGTQAIMQWTSPSPASQAILRQEVFLTFQKNTSTE